MYMRTHTRVHAHTVIFFETRSHMGYCIVPLFLQRLMGIQGFEGQEFQSNIVTTYNTCMVKAIGRSDGYGISLARFLDSDDHFSLHVLDQIYPALAA